MLHPDFSELEAEFGEVIGLLNEGRQEPDTERPSEDVWSAIADGLDHEVGEIPPAPPMVRAEGDVELPGTPGNLFDQPSHAGGLPDGADGPSNVHRLRPRSAPDQSSGGSPVGKRFAILTAVAAAILLVAVPLSLALRGDGFDQRAELLALGESAAVGTAELSDRTLEISIEGLEPLDDATYELWLLDLEGGELEDLEWIGNVDEDGTFTVPEGLDLDEFSVVDVSIEPKDGDPTHSGNSVLRGPLSED